VNELLTYGKIHQLTQGTWLTAPANASQTLRSGAFDTRALGKAEIFFTWGGESDAHQYLNQLTNSNIRLAIVEKSVPPLGNIAILKVKNSLEALHVLASYLAKSFKGKIITITGSSGKTTAKSWLSHILKHKFHLLHNIGSFNNQIGCPITILDLDTDHDIIVLEMGTSGLGELESLSAIAPADVSMLLNVGHAHIGEFGSRENIYKAKTEIFSHQKKSAISLIPSNDENIQKYLKNKDICFFGKESPQYSWETKAIDLDRLGQVISFNTPWGEKSVFINQLGNYVGELLSAIIAACHHLGLEWQDIEPCLGSFPQDKGRSKLIKLESGLLILDDTYNANPESTINMLNTLCMMDAQRYIAVVGNLAELEDNLTESAQYIIQNIPEKLTHLLLSGETGQILLPLVRSKRSNLDVRWFESVQETYLALNSLITKNSVVGIKGSRSAHMERVLYALQGKLTDCDLSRCGRLSMCIDCEEF